MLDSIIQTTLDSFDFSFCITVNVLTYLIIKCFSESKLKIKMTTWRKRLILIMAILVIGIIYASIGIENKLILNSAILAPVTWSWIFRPLCKKFKLDYIKNNIDETYENI